MKQRKANQPGDLIRHVVDKAPADAAPNHTYQAKASIKIVRGRPTLMWRIFNGGPRK